MKKIIKNLSFFLIIFIIIFCAILSYKNKQTNLFQDFLFTKLLGSSKTNSQITNQYIFNIDYKNTNLKSINLKDTIKTLVEEKIAPGTRGSFDIIIKSDKDLHYQINFLSKNEKPQNLKFKAKCGEEYISDEEEYLENLSKILKGEIKAKENKKITIEWNWSYENYEKGNAQDTMDANVLNKYEFEIYTFGMEGDVI